VTLYFRRFKIRNPFKPRTPACGETLIAQDAEEERIAEKRRRRNFFRRSVSWLWRRGHGKSQLQPATPNDFGEEIDANTLMVTGQTWEGDWTSVMKEYAGTDEEISH
jgi:hypothetical protein